MIFNLILAIFSENRGQKLEEFFVTENSRHIQRPKDHDFRRFLVVFGLASACLGIATLN
jgi:hypothetical protein